MPKPMSFAMPWADTVASFMARKDATRAPSRHASTESIRRFETDKSPLDHFAMAEGHSPTPISAMKPSRPEIDGQYRDAERRRHARRVEDGPIAAQGYDEDAALGIGRAVGITHIEVASES